jgi:hypothetical protein
MLQDKDPVEQVASLLRSLGQTAEEVATVLRTHRCRGFRYGSLPNPVIRYVYRKFDDGSLTLVYGPPQMKPELLCLRVLDGQTKEIRLPAAVAAFLADFDDGLYPDLSFPQ